MATYRKADRVIAHSTAAAELVSGVHGVEPERVVVIPHGDLSPASGILPAKEEARQQLGLPSRPLCLMFGRVDPYKGIEEIVDFWERSRPTADLVLSATLI